MRNNTVKELRTSGEQFKIFMDFHSDPVAVVQDGKYQLINTAFEKLFGYTSEDLENGLSISDLVKKSENKRAMKIFEAEGSRFNAIWRHSGRVNLVAKDGGIKSCESFVSSILYKGHPAKLAILRDKANTEKKLQESERKYRLLADNVVDALSVVDLDTLEYVYCSPSIENLLGYTDKEIIGTALGDQKTIKSKKFMTDVIKEELSKEELSKEELSKEDKNGEDLYRSRKLELELVHKNGSLVWAEVTARILRDENGKVMAILVARDITDRKEAEKKLQESDRKYRLLADNVVDALSVVDLDTLEYVYCSPSVENLLGYTDKEIIGTALGDQKTLKSKKFITDVIKEELSKEGKNGEDLYRSRKLELELVHKNGSLVWAEVTARILRDENGKVMAILVARDITDRKNKEREIQIFQSLINQSNDDLFVIEPKTSRLLYVNEKACENLGYERKELLNMSVVDIDATFPDKVTWAKHIQEVSEKGFMFQEGVYRRKDGTTFPVEVSIKNILKEEINYIVATARDITERKQAEIALRLSEASLEQKNIKLEESNITLNFFLKKIENDKLEVEKKVLINVKELINPYLEKMKQSGLTDRQLIYAELMESNIRDITSQFTRALSLNYSSITPTEIQVANFIKQDKTSREIAELMCISSRTVDTHRNNIRKKLGLKRPYGNLRSHLLSLQ